MIKLIDLLKEIDLDSISDAPFSKLPPGLKLISQRGTTRNIYEYNKDYILKIAKNNKGIEQNKEEIKNLTKYISPLFPKLKSYDDRNYKYIVVEKVNDFKSYNEFYKFIFPNIEKIAKKFIQFANEYRSKYTIPDSIGLEKSTVYYFILKAWLHKEDIIFITKEENKKIWDKYTKKGIYNVDDNELINQTPPNQRITFMTYDELNKELNTTDSTNLLKQLIDDGFKVTDWHWKNFGYKDNQLKLIDLGL
jgi:hypothetical protein